MANKDLRIITILDNSESNEENKYCCINVSLWEEHASNNKIKEGELILIMNCKVQEYLSS